MRFTDRRQACLAIILAPITIAPALGDELFRFLPDVGYESLQFGESVALNGGLALVGGEGIFTSPVPGNAFLFDAATGTLLSDFPQPTLPGDATPSDSRFYGVALSDPIPLPGGRVAPVALIGTTTIEFCFCYPTLVRAYDLTDPANPALLWNLTPNDAELNDEFGEAMAIDGNFALIGTPAADDNGGLTGAAYLFDLTTGQQLSKLLASDGESVDQFGFSVDMNDGLAIIGARRDDDAATNAGAAYIFDVSDPTAPVELAKLVPNAGDPQDFFGFSVGIQGSTAIVGAIFDDDAGFDAGAAYIYDITTPNAPILAQKLTAPDAQNNDDFGWAVAMERQGDRIAALIGARTDDDAGPGNGAAYLFDVTTPTNPLFIEEFLPSTVTNVDTFGWAVDIDEGVALIGSPGADDQGSSSGAAYLVEAGLPPASCNPADLAPPFGITDLDDVDAFINAFVASEPLADLVPPFGIVDLQDVDAFITAFLAGCP
ncbi:MAG: FG-GAP repeat protein [Planctomycetota bacterium]